jgi:hypothetical protein
VVEGYWFSMLSQSVMSWFGGNNGALRARAFGGHEDADVEQDQMRSCQTKACRLQSRQERLVVKTQARPSSKRGKNKAIKSRVERSGQLEGNALLQCKCVEEPTAAGRNFCQRRKVRFVQKVPEDGSLPSVSQS